jgi:hypothetical protein
MGFIKISKRGEEFILNRCISNGVYGNDKFSGKRKFALPKSTVAIDTVFTAKPKDDEQKDITTPEVLAQNLISWFNFYCKEYKLDANIIAAQAYVESGYFLWVYSEGGAMGISQFLDAAVFDTIIKNKYTFQQEWDDIVNGMAGDTSNIIYHIPNFNTGDKSKLSTPQTAAIAKSNRAILFQNVINNPKIMIKAQCFMMDKIGQRNNNLASSSLFAYNRGAYLTSNSYDDVIQKAAKQFGNSYIKEGLEYVSRVFGVLGGYEPLLPKSTINPNERISFGFLINTTEQELKNFNISDFVRISGDFPISQAQDKYIRELHPVAQNLFRAFIYNIEQNLPYKVQIHSGYRSYADQARIQKENQAYTPPRPAANPGASFHNYGLALDIEIIETTGSKQSYSFNASVDQWKLTGVIEIANKFGLRWGGTFLGNQVDVVHFDLGNKYSIGQCKSIAENTYGSDPNKVQGNQIPLPA